MTHKDTLAVIKIMDKIGDKNGYFFNNYLINYFN